MTPGSLLERLPQPVDADAALVRRGRFLTTRVLVDVGEAPYLVETVEAGEATIEGDLRPFKANLRCVKEVLAAPHGMDQGA